MENLRETVLEAEEKKFKKSIFGLDKKETLDYIESLEQSLKSSVANYEKKLKERSDALTMALREKETLAEKVGELEKKVKYLSGDIEEEKSRIIAENNALKEENTRLAELQSENEILTSKVTELQTGCDFSDGENKRLSKIIVEKDEVISEQCRKNAESERNIKTEMEKLRMQNESQRKIQLYNIKKLKEQLTTAAEILEKL